MWSRIHEFALSWALNSSIDLCDQESPIIYEFPLLWAQAARAEDTISPTASMINAGNLKDKMKIKKKIECFYLPDLYSSGRNLITLPEFFSQ